MAKILSVINTPYRATLEEQDDTALWFTSACGSSGAEMTVLLTGSAVNYAVKTQNPTPIRFGSAGVEHPPKLQNDLKSLCENGIHVFLLRDDVEQRGIKLSSLMQEVEMITRPQLAKFIRQYDQVWHW